MSDATWVWISMDAKAAKRQGMPARIPVPKAEFEGLADRGLSIENARRWTGSFLGELRDPAFKAEHAAEIAKLEVFLSKGELWQRARQAFEAKDYKRATSTLRMISPERADGPLYWRSCSVTDSVHCVFRSVMEIAAFLIRVPGPGSRFPNLSPSSSEYTNP